MFIQDKLAEIILSDIRHILDAYGISIKQWNLEYENYEGIPCLNTAGHIYRKPLHLENGYGCKTCQLYLMMYIYITWCFCLLTFLFLSLVLREPEDGYFVIKRLQYTLNLLIDEFMNLAFTIIRRAIEDESCLNWMQKYIWLKHKNVRVLLNNTHIQKLHNTISAVVVTMGTHILITRVLQ